MDKTQIGIESHLKVFMDNSPVVAWIKDPETWQYLYLNKVFEKTFNVTLALWQGKTDFDLWPEAVAKNLRENDMKVLESAAPTQVFEDVPIPNGGLRHWIVFKFVINSSGKKLVAGTAFDITELVVAQNALKEKNEELEKLNQSMVGREMRMAELKNENEQLKKKIGAT